MNKKNKKGMLDTPFELFWVVILIAILAILAVFFWDYIKNALFGWILN